MNKLLKVFKSLLLVLVLGVFALAIVSCGKEETPTPNPDPVVNPDPEPEPQPEPEPEPQPEPEPEPEPEVTIDISKVKFLNGTFNYDGKAHGIYVNPLTVPQGVTVTYENNEQTEIGTYTVKAILKDAKGNVLGELTAKLTINKAKKNVSKVTFESASFIWEKDKEFKIEVKNLPDGVYVQYENNTLTEVGKLEATAKLYDSYDDELLKTLTATIQVKYRVVVDNELFASQELVYDGEEHTILLANASEYANVTYTNNTATENGTYLASALVTTNEGEKFEYRAVLNIDNPFNQAFRDYTDEMFVYFLEGDQSTLNIFMIDYESFGFEHQEAEWSSYDRYTEEDNNNDKEELTRLENEFALYNRDDLNSYQKVDYDKIANELNFLHFMIYNPEYILMRQTYVDQYGGYAGDIPTTMEAYQIRRLEDIEDIISYIASIETAFPTYITYALDRAEAGYPLSNFTIQGMVDYLDGVSKRAVPQDTEEKFKEELEEAGYKGDELKNKLAEKIDEWTNTPYYLIAILEDKISASQELLGLTNEQVAGYITRLDTAFDAFLQAHIDLANGLLEQCLNKAEQTDYSYLATYGEKGQILYEHLLRNRLGLSVDMTLDEYLEFVETTIQKYSSAYSNYSSNADVQAIMNGEVNFLDTTDANEIIEYLRNTFAPTIVYNLENEPTIGIAYMDASVTANTTTLAYYMKSALDSTDKEFIHLNGDALGEDYLETIKTLAHEGYPGHLYAYVNTKENTNLSNFVRVSTNTGHGEGWAKYVECALCDYMAKVKGGAWVNAMAKDKYWDLFVYQLYSRLDFGINYQGWGPKQVAKYMKNMNLVSDEDTAKDLIRDLSEMPSQYAAYGYGQALFYELHDEAKALLGDNYSEQEFNAMLLGHGWIGLGDLEELYHNYMVQKCFLANVDFE